MDKFKIVLSANGRGEVWRNGEQVRCVRSVTVRAGVNETSVVTLELLAAEVEIEAEADALIVERSVTDILVEDITKSRRDG